MQDEWGYEELVVHPPPINYLTGALTVAVFKQNMMLRFSMVFSKAIFWLENLGFFIPQMLVREALLAPLIYIRLIYNILRAESNVLNALVLVVAWLIIGPFYLLANLRVDMYYYFKVLLDYHEYDTVGEDQAAADALQDKIVIYNEIIDTIRAIMNIFKYKKSARKVQKKNKSKGGAPPSPTKAQGGVHAEFHIRNENPGGAKLQKHVSNKFDLLEELQRQRDETDMEEGYTINADLIIEAWKRFRPVNLDDDRNTGKRKRLQPRTKQSLIRDVFGRRFIYTLMSEIHLKLYNFAELEAEVSDRRAYKREFTGYYKNKLEKHVDEEADRESTARLGAAPKAEVDMVTAIIDKFVFDSDSKHPRQVDLNLTLKALPARVDENNCYRVELFDFPAMQQAIIACQNQEQDMLFKFYDNRNKNRLRKLQTQADRSHTLTETLQQDSTTLTSVLKRIETQGPLKESVRRGQQHLVLDADELEGEILKKIDPKAVRNGVAQGLGRRQ